MVLNIKPLRAGICLGIFKTHCKCNNTAQSLQMNKHTLNENS